MTLVSQSVRHGALIVRLRNWVGEVVLGLPTLVQLAQAGYELHLIGKPWAADLLAGYGWPVQARVAGARAAVAQLSMLGRQLTAADPSFPGRINTLLLTSSLSSAIEARLAGLRACGAAADGRSLLLARSVRLQAGLHVDEGYWRVGAALSGAASPPGSAPLRLAPAHEIAARTLREAHRLHTCYAVLCPFSGSGDAGGRRRWPHFTALAGWLQTRGITPVICHGGSTESILAQRDYPGAVIPERLPLGVYAALMRDAWCTVANDTGPGHVAATAGARLVSLYGPESFKTTWMPPVGPQVRLLQNAVRWPDIEEVIAHLPSSGPS